MNMKRPLINILTRTHRKEYFIKCEESVSSQSYKNYRHILCIDNESSLGYINSTDYIQVKREKKKNFKHFPYNLYFNEMYKEIENGWIMFLDDDDHLPTTGSLETLATNIEKNNNKDTLYIWKVKFPNRGKAIPTHSFGNKIVMGDIASCGFSFHSSHLKKAHWDNKKCGDFRVVNRLYNFISNTVWIDDILASLQDEPHGGK